METSNTATAEERRDEGHLAGLAATIKEAAAFADGMPKEYRARAFDLAFERLSGGVARVAGLVSPPVMEPALAVTPIATGGLSALARELEVEPRALARVVAIGEDGKLSLIGRVESRTNAEMQVEYSAVFAFVKERVFNQLDVPSEELRDLCRSKSCYNQNHFTDYYARSDLLSPVGDANSRAYRLTKKGVEAGKELLKKMIES